MNHCTCKQRGQNRWGHGVIALCHLHQEVKFALNVKGQRLYKYFSLVRMMGAISLKNNKNPNISNAIKTLLQLGLVKLDGHWVSMTDEWELACHKQ